MFVVSLLGIGACERDSRTPDPQPAPPKPKTLHGEATPVLQHAVFVYHRDKAISGKADEKNQRHLALPKI